MIAVDIAHWPFPLGWLYVAVTGNLVASAIAFMAGWWWKGRHILRHLDELHRYHQIGKYRP